jgi:thiol:disulfide interchange protein DsbD
VRALVATVALLLTFSQTASAQLRGVKAELTSLVESDAAPGAPVRAALQVRIPDRFHVQSDAPRDPTLIPTVLTIDAPEGVKVTEIVFPQATEFKQVGQAQPLLVFEHEFAIGVGMEVGSNVPSGRLEVPGHLRYQACDDRLCYAPVTADVLWTLTVARGGAERPSSHSEVFGSIAF